MQQNTHSNRDWAELSNRTFRVWAPIFIFAAPREHDMTWLCDIFSSFIDQPHHSAEWCIGATIINVFWWALFRKMRLSAAGVVAATAAPMAFWLNESQVHCSLIWMMASANVFMFVNVNVNVMLIFGWFKNFNLYDSLPYPSADWPWLISLHMHRMKIVCAFPSTHPVLM